jgi:FkbM family methyltransferase
MGESKLELTGYRREQGLLWPSYDTRCAEVTFRECEAILPRLLPHVPRRRAVLQAGGNCGQLVRMLAGEFGAVYTFEPDARNFVALTVNTAEWQNVFRYQAALGEKATQLRGMASGDKHFPDVNCGALYMNGGGLIPTLTIDHLALPELDLVFLDIEGGERAALAGGAETLDRCRPIVVIEDKGLGGQFFGEHPGAAELHLIQRHGYKRLARIRHDTILGPTENRGSYHESAVADQSESREPLLHLA